MLSTIQIFLMIPASPLSLSSTLQHLTGAHHIIADKIDLRNQGRHLKKWLSFFHFEDHIKEELPASNTILLALKLNCTRIAERDRKKNFLLFIVKKCCHLIEFKRVTEYFFFII